MKAWIIIVSTVVGALSGFVIDFLWTLGPWPSSLKWVMVACALIGGLLAVSFLLPWPWQDGGDGGRT